MNVFITGGTTGLGLAIGKLYLAKGDSVGVCSFEPAAEAKGRLPDGMRYYRADVTDAAAMRRAIRKFHDDHGSVDLVIANAGLNHPKKKIPDFELGRRVINVNIIGVTNTFGPAIEIMKEQRSGHLAAIASASGFYGYPGLAFYGATKAFVITFCETLVTDLTAFGIHVTCLAPGFIGTTFVKNNKHKMPFLMTQDEAACRAVAAIGRKQNLYIFPLPVMLLTSVVRRLPKKLFYLLMERDILGFAKGSE